MTDTYEKDLGQKSSLTASDYIRVVGTDNVSYKQPLLDVGAKGQIGQMGLLSDANIDNFANNKIYGAWWLNCSDADVTGTKPATSGQGLLICKQQSATIYRQVYVGIISGTAFKVRYCNNGTWTAWGDTGLGAEINALNSNTLKLYRQRTTDGTGNLANMLQTAGLYLWVMKYPADTSAYYIGFAYKADGANAVQTVIANNKLSLGAQNVAGTIVARYNDVATAGIVGTAYTLG